MRPHALRRPPVIRRCAKQLRAPIRKTGRPAGTGRTSVCFAGAQSAGLLRVCLADPGDEIAVFEPRYVTYDGVIDTPGAVRVDVPLAAPQGFRFDPDALGRAVTPRTRAVLLNTPHNPTGIVAAREELEAITAIAKRHDLWVLSDEVYGSTYTYQLWRFAACRMGERTVTFQLAVEVARHAGVAPRMGGGAAGPGPAPDAPDRVDGVRDRAVHAGCGAARAHHGPR